MVGKTISHYQILDKLGEGGMGVVYRARDTKLGRDVAIKVLPEAFARDNARMERFQREARTLASLNHPNIASIYGLEETNGTRAIVMELAEGETLAERIGRGALPLDEVLDIARQIAEALEAAHEKGIIHRDLKPGNIMVSSAGQVKVLDFGLAKALEGDVATTDPEQSPTVTIGATQAGVILGTAGYMSPEQAKGKRADRRADIWAFGVIVYEMLAGRRAFTGETVSDSLASILAREPDWAGLPKRTPTSLRRVLQHCLVKDGKNRLQAIGDARILLGEVALNEAGAQDEGPKRSQPPFRWLGAALAAGAALALLLAFALGWRPSSAGDGAGPRLEQLLQTTIDLSGAPPLALDAQASLGIDSQLVDISPDGGTLVYVGESDGVTRLYSRSLDRYEIRPISGTEGAVQPFFSPDGKSVGFLTTDEVKVVDLDGGAPQLLCDAVTPVGATWTTEGMIYFGNKEATTLASVTVEGGDPMELVAPRDDVFFGKALPGGGHVFVTRLSGGLSADFAEIQVVDVRTGESTSVIRNGYDARYVEPGQVVFGRTGDLFAAGFDREHLEVTSEARRIASGVRMQSTFRIVQAAASSNGLLVYVPGGDAAQGKLAWVDREGREEFLTLPEQLYGQVALSPDGRLLAVHVLGVRDSILVADTETGDTLHLQGSGHYRWPRWSPNGERIAFSSREAETQYGVLVQTVNSASKPDVFWEGNRVGFPLSWTPDGSGVIVQHWPDIERLIAPASESAPMPRGLEVGGVLESQLDIHRDGRWVAAYTGQGVEVRSLDGERRYQVSRGFGAEPRWCSNCDELFYRDGNGFYSVKVRFEPTFVASPPELVFQVSGLVSVNGWTYDVSPDGQRLLVVKQERALPRDKIHVVQNWEEQ